MFVGQSVQMVSKDIASDPYEGNTRINIVFNTDCNR